MTQSHIDPTRRDVLLALAACVAPSGCAGSLLPPPQNYQPRNAQGLPLTIDVHTHVFNGSDLQVKEFIAQTAINQDDSELRAVVRAMGGTLQWMAWHHAPSARDELRALERYGGLARQAPQTPPRTSASTAFQDGYSRGRLELQRAADTVQKTPDASVLGPTPGMPGEGLGAAIRGLPMTYDEYDERRQDPLDVLGSQPHLKGVISFVLHHFNYRFVNAIDYLTTYARTPGLQVDLMVASLVDYDWWLAKGRAPATSLGDQVDVMRRITVLLNGRVHGFAPYCPFREAMTSRGNDDGEAMRLVKRAVGEAGFLGIKLYPPMGFAAWGNASLSVWQGKRTLPAAAGQSDFGQRLDRAMRRLYEWCLANDVPIMAHANRSNGPYDEFKALAGAEHWDRALSAFPGLKVSFGHLGDTDIEDHDADRSRAYIDLMTPADGSRGARVFADSGYFAGVLGRPQALIDVLDRVFEASETRLLANRLMYGSDWTMVLPQRNVDDYLVEFSGVLRAIDRRRAERKQTPLASAFFGETAVEFLGLRRGKPARVRLENFYDRHRMPAPGWLAKVDALGGRP